MRRLIWVALMVLSVGLAVASPSMAGTYTATGRIVDVNGQPRANWTVAVSYHYDPLYWWTIHVTTDAGGHFTATRSFGSSVTEITVTPQQGHGTTLSTPSPGTYNFGDLIGGDCRNCPLPQDGSGP
jgi:hypothetical protein